MFQLRQTGSDTIKALNIKHTNEQFYAFEEKIVGYLENFLLILTQTRAALFMRFVSGDERVKKSHR